MHMTGNSDKALPKDYSISGDAQNRVFGVFNAIAIIATTYGNGIIPEIQVPWSSGASSESNNLLVVVISCGQ